MLHKRQPICRLMFVCENGRAPASSACCITPPDRFLFTINADLGLICLPSSRLRSIRSFLPFLSRLSSQAAGSRPGSLCSIQTLMALGQAPPPPPPPGFSRMASLFLPSKESAAGPVCKLYSCAWKGHNTLSRLPIQWRPAGRPNNIKTQHEDSRFNTY